MYKEAHMVFLVATTFKSRCIEEVAHEVGLSAEPRATWVRARGRRGRHES